MFHVAGISRSVRGRLEDENGNLYAHVINPKNINIMVFGLAEIQLIFFKFDVDFPMIKWEDDQAWKISDLKKLKVVEKLLKTA